MKKNLIAIAFAATAVLSMSNAMAAAGTVNFEGEILDNACVVDIGANNTMTVPLGSYNKAEFKISGDTTAARKFTINLKDCPAAVTTAKVVFDGTHEATDSKLLAVDSTVAGAATGVAINLMTADKVQLPLNAVNDYSYNLVSTASNALDFYAQYKSTAATVTAGPANSVSTFSVVYN